MRGEEREIEFNVEAYTARLIGRENVSKLEGAVLEIVKNAYDADAKTFCLYYSESQNCIFIMDNGCGMTEDIIKTHWMTIGNSSKKSKYVTPGKRIQTGAKGIGRFALDRLSDRCRMLTISDQGGLEWIVNWEDFDGNKKISDVKAKIFDTDVSLLEYVGVDSWMNAELAQYIKTLNYGGTGTVFCLEGLHDTWDDKTLMRLRNHLENLLPPDVAEDFKILFFADTTDRNNAEIISANVDSYDYKIDFQIKGDDLEIQILRNEFDFRGKEQTVFKEADFGLEDQQYFHGKQKEEKHSVQEVCGKQNCIGDFSGTLYFYKITQTAKDQEKFYTKSITGRANLVKRFGGIKLYRDKFRVRPYGEYGDNDFDWLELSARRNRSPAGLGHSTGNWRVGAEQIFGNVAISRDNINLEDDANRNGIQEGIGLTQLKQILLFTIGEFERDRQSVGRKLAAYEKAKDELAKKMEEMRRLAEERKKWEEERAQEERSKKEQGREQQQEKELLRWEPAPSANPTEVNALLDAMEQRKEQELQELRDENKMLQTLATTGIVTNMFMHEIRTLTNNIGQELDSAYEALKYDNDMDYATKNIMRAITLKKNFRAWFGITIESIKKDKRMRKKQNLKTMLYGFMNTWNEILRKNRVILHYSCEDNIEFWCFEFDIENIISNLISNSMVSFDREMETVLEKREITLSISALENGFLLDYSDTGWGLVPKYKERPEMILEAFESSRTLIGEEEDGTGMGMWIVNRTVLEYNGSIDLSENRRAEMGFYIKIQFVGRGA
ncbi:MAG: sensor histidine kinase [Lachnospiraceae bacterium]|nr:sensor histidine kinase [Lachnospiraceae bacterium]